ncbi:hypothetical protein [Ligilactobacillus salivarius]|uniref:hypothetical protein n=1 Tax=Ligilactobacillus salivarius TaxID=1624 RepID=UPI001E3F3271|nr:hypothetical protein [Ligilactobacillus salivarius]UHL93384.1 hypothetical protein LVD18_03610 [Ligilactobacillus salivarius]
MQKNFTLSVLNIIQPFFDTKEQVVNIYDVTKITLVKINKKYPENLLNIIDLIVEIVYYKVVKNSKGDFVIWK